ncbi:MAG: DUF1820 family protein [Bdellovibrionales bacterium]
MAQKKDNHYVVHYRDPKSGEIQSLKARKIADSNLGLSFVLISDFLFDTEGVVIKPSEEQMQKRLENVKGLHLSIYSIVSVEEVGHHKLNLKRDRSNLVSFPSKDS